MGVIVAIDGPSGAGKSTVSRAVSERLGYQLLDTGALYRGAAWLAIGSGVDPENGPEVASLIDAADFAFERVDGEQHLFVNGTDVASQIRTPEMSEGASKTSAQPAVRAALLDLQRRLGEANDCVVEGRDIGTVVFPAAAHKFFLTASMAARIERRRLQYEEKGLEADEEQLRRDVEERDKRDSERDIAPLKPAADAQLVDSTGLSFDEVVGLICGAVLGA